MALPEPFMSQQDRSDASAHMFVSQNGQFVSQAPFATERASSTKRPAEVGEFNEDRDPKRFKTSGDVDLLQEVEAQLEKQRRNEQMLKLLGKSIPLPTTKSHSDLPRTKRRETNRSSQHDRDEIHRPQRLRSPDHGVEDLTREPKHEYHATAHKYGIDLAYLNEQHAMIGDVSNKGQPPDEILFYLDDSESSPWQVASIQSSPEIRVLEHGQAQEYNIPIPTEAQNPNEHSSNSASVERDFPAARASQTRRKSQVEPGSPIPFEEALEEPPESQLSDGAISWSISPTPKAPMDNGWAGQQYLPPDSSYALTSPEVQCLHSRNPSEKRSAPASDNERVRGNHTFGYPGEHYAPPAFSIDQAGVDDGSDSELDEAEPHALGEDSLRSLPHNRTPSSSQQSSQKSHGSGLQVQETPYAGRANSPTDDGCSPRPIPQSSPLKLGHNVTPFVSSYALSDVAAKPAADQSKGAQHASIGSINTSSPMRDDSSWLTPQMAQSASSITSTIRTKRRISQSSHTIEAHGPDILANDVLDGFRPSRVRHATNRGNIGASLDLSSQQSVLEDPAITARRARREFMHNARIAKGTATTKLKDNQAPAKDDRVLHQSADPSDPSRAASQALPHVSGSSKHQTSQERRYEQNVTLSQLSQGRETSKHRPSRSEEERKIEGQAMNDRVDPISIDDDEKGEEEEQSTAIDDHNASQLQDPKPWYKGETPFKEFARNYSRLKILDGVLGDHGGRELLRKKDRLIDVLGWEL